MKKSEAEKDFTDLIKETLDNYEEQYILGSWEYFLKKRKRRRRIVLWITGTGIAASLLLGWLGYRSMIPESSVNAGSRNSFIIKNATPDPGDSIKEPLIVYLLPPLKVGNPDTRTTGNNSLKRSTGLIRPGDLINSSDKNPPDIARKEAGKTQDPRTDARALLRIKIDPPAFSPVSGLSYIGNRDNITRYVSMTQRSDYSREKTANVKGEITDLPVRRSEEKRQSHRVRFGINVAPGFTSTSTSASMAYSAGINADYSLSGKIQLSTGLQFERQSVINESTDSPAWLPQGETRVALTDLDLPLNLTWKFVARNSSSWYLSGGVSSVIYLGEKYTRTSYVQKMVQDVEVMAGRPSVTYRLENVKVTEQTTDAPLKTLDFAGKLNFILGFESKLSSRINLHIEPFVKIPLSGLSNRDLVFTTSGITCKISF